MADSQINPRTRAFIDEYGLRDRVLFASDEDSQLIKRFAILKEDPEPMEEGVPHPTTYLIDREGVVRFRDVRTDFHIWLAPETITAALANIP
jgi:peroxiredoxin